MNTGYSAIEVYLSLGWSSNNTGAIISKTNNRRGSSKTFGILNNLRGRAFHDSNARVGGTKIDTDNVLGFGLASASLEPNA